MNSPTRLSTFGEHDLPRWLSGRFAVVTLLGFGALLSLTVGGSGSLTPWLCFIAAAVVARIPLVHNTLQRTSNRLNAATTREKVLLAFSLAFFAAACVWAAKFQTGRTVAPRWHDEFAYLTQAAQLATGRLWMPPHPQSAFFETFYVFAQPVYAAQYFVGASLFFAAGNLLHLPYWVVPLTISCGCVVLTFVLVSAYLDTTAGVLAAIVLSMQPQLQFASLMVLAHYPTLLLALIAIIAAVWFQKSGRTIWLGILGTSAGWMLITRPLDAVAFCIPLVLVMWKRLGPGWRRRSQNVAIIVLCASPFLALQGVTNKGVTGDTWTSPWTMYQQNFYPQLTLGYRTFDPSLKPDTTLEQKQRYYNVLSAFIRAHTPDRFITTLLHERLLRAFAIALPAIPMLAFLPLGACVMLRSATGCLLVLPVFLFVLLYAFYPLFLPNYPIVLAPSLVTIAVYGARVVGGRLPSHLHQQFRATILLGFMTVASLTMVTGWSNQLKTYDFPHLLRANQMFDAIPQASGLIFIKYGDGLLPDEELVYNPWNAWPDDARVVRAHDLGEQNIFLINYYASIGQNRAVYQFERSSEKLTYLRMTMQLAHSANRKG